MQGFPGFPGRVGTLYTTFIVGQGSQFERIQGTIKYPTFDKNLGITRESIILWNENESYLTSLGNLYMYISTSDKQY